MGIGGKAAMWGMETEGPNTTVCSMDETIIVFACCVCVFLCRPSEVLVDIYTRQRSL